MFLLELFSRIFFLADFDCKNCYFFFYWFIICDIKFNIFSFYVFVCVNLTYENSRIVRWSDIRREFGWVKKRSLTLWLIIKTFNFLFPLLSYVVLLFSWLFIFFIFWTPSPPCVGPWNTNNSFIWLLIGNFEQCGRHLVVKVWSRPRARVAKTVVTFSAM